MPAQVWADHFDDTLEDVFALQDRVALSVAGVIEPAVQRIEANWPLPTGVRGCYDLYLRAGLPAGDPAQEGEGGRR